jgi:hypothetical protein
MGSHAVLAVAADIGISSQSSSRTRETAPPGSALRQELQNQRAATVISERLALM